MSGPDQIYTEKCKCGREITVETQKDDDPEYYTEVGVLCDCGNFVYFQLPVN